MQVERIKKTQDFKLISRKAKKFHSRSFLILYNFTDKKDRFGYGITVTKKIGTAVIRNLCKRRIKAIISKIARDISVKPLEIVIIVKSEFLKQSFQDLRSELLNAIMSLK